MKVANKAFTATGDLEGLNVDTERLEARTLEVRGLCEHACGLVQSHGGIRDRSAGVEGHRAFEHGVGKSGVVCEAGAEHGVHLGGDVGNTLVLVKLKGQL